MPISAQRARFLQVECAFSVCAAAALRTLRVALSKDAASKGRGDSAAENAAQSDSFNKAE
jgi:hypothetical protein